MIEVEKKHDYYLVKLTLGKKVYFNELSVLEAFSTENLEESYEQLSRCCLKFNGIEKMDLEKDFFDLIQLNEKAYASVKFCLEGLFIQTLPIIEKKNYEINTLVTNLDELKNLSICTKIKIGRKDISIEKKLIETLLAKNPQIKKIRLDANQGLAPSDLFEHEKIEYFEEPFKDYSQYQNCNQTIAIDENIEKFLKDPKPPRCIKYLIYKPKIRLGISGMIKSIKAHPNMKHILSHSYENRYGANLMRDLPLYIKELNWGYQGLDYSYLGSDSKLPIG